MKTLVAAVLILSLCWPLSTQACKCQEVSFTESFQYKDLIMDGIVLSQERVAVADTSDRSHFKEMPVHCYKFLVKKVYKGKVTSDTVNIYTGMNGASCGWRFTLGERYIVYGDRQDYFYRLGYKCPKGKNIFWTSTCHRTMPFDEDEIAALKKMRRNKKAKP